MATNTLNERGTIIAGLLLVAVAAAEFVVRPRVSHSSRQSVDAAVVALAVALVVVSVATLANYYRDG